MMVLWDSETWSLKSIKSFGDVITMRWVWRYQAVFSIVPGRDSRSLIFCPICIGWNSTQRSILPTVPSVTVNWKVFHMMSQIIILKVGKSYQAAATCFGTARQTLLPSLRLKLESFSLIAWSVSGWWRKNIRGILPPPPEKIEIGS